MPVTTQQLLAILAHLRVGVLDTEQQLVQLIAKLLTQHHIPYRREVTLVKHNRIDFVVDDSIGIEVKKGKPTSRRVAAQVARYCSSPRITELILVVERNVYSPIEEAHGKRVHYLALHKLMGVSF